MSLPTFNLLYVCFIVVMFFFLAFKAPWQGRYTKKSAFALFIYAFGLLLWATNLFMYLGGRESWPPKVVVLLIVVNACVIVWHLISARVVDKSNGR